VGQLVGQHQLDLGARGAGKDEGGQQNGRLSQAE